MRVSPSRFQRGKLPGMPTVASPFGKGAIVPESGTSDAVALAIALLVIGQLASGVLASSVLANKGYDGAKGFLLGVLLNLYGVAIALALSPTMDKQIAQRQAVEDEIRRREGQGQDGDQQAQSSLYAQQQEALRQRYEQQQRRGQ